MIRLSVIVLLFVWGMLTLLSSIFLWLGEVLPNSGTIVMTNNIFLDRHERFEIYDLAQGITYQFSPVITDGALAVSLAPNKQQIALLGVDNNQFALSITTLNGDAIITPISINRSLDFSEVRWSANGRFFTFYGSIDESALDLHVVDTRLDTLISISSNSGQFASSAWSPDDTQIAYTHSQSDESASQIWIADGDGKNQRQLTSNNTPSYCPTWSQNGETIAYIESVGNSDKLRYININGTENTSYHSSINQMTTCPWWIGNSIVFVSLDLDDFDTVIVLMDVHTGNITHLIEVEQTVGLQLWH